MSASAGAAASPFYSRRARSVWLAILGGTLAFCVLCSVSGIGAYDYLRGVTQPEHATLERIRGDQLLVVRHLHRDYEAVEEQTALNEGDQVTTGSDTESNIVLFDQSTVHMYFGTQVVLETLRASRFIGSKEETALSVNQGTIVVSTASEDVTDYSAAEYTVNTPAGVVEVGRNSTVRVQISGADQALRAQVVTTFGGAWVASEGRRVQLKSGEMSILSVNSPPTEARPTEQELVRNGGLRDPATSGKETVEGGGLGVAAWEPILEQSSDSPVDVVPLTRSVSIATENLPGQNVVAAWLSRDVGGGYYARVGLRQEINAPASFLRYVALKAAVKIGEQTKPIGGPQGDVFPLTFRVIYTTADGKQQSWQQSVFCCQGDGEIRNSTPVRSPGTWSTLPTAEQLASAQQAPSSGGSSPGTTPAPTTGQAPSGPVVDWTSGALIIKKVDSQSSIGQDIAVIDAIEIYGIGDRFQSWVTDISMIAR